MTEFVKCGRCGTVYDMYGTHGTTVVNGYCPMCGLHHNGTHSIVYPVLKPSPLAAQPINTTEIVRCQDCKYYQDHNFGSKLDWCRYFHHDVHLNGFCKWGEVK